MFDLKRNSQSDAVEGARELSAARPSNIPGCHNFLSSLNLAATKPLNTNRAGFPQFLSAFERFRHHIPQRQAIGNCW